MSLDFWPGTEIRRSTHNGFSMGLSGDWSDVIELSKARARSAAAAERQRIAGKDRSTIHGLSKKNERKSYYVKKGTNGRPVGALQPNSKAARIRAHLAEQGPRTHMQISVECDIPYGNISGLMKADISRGRIVKVRALGEKLRYAMAGDGA